MNELRLEFQLETTEIPSRIGHGFGEFSKSCCGELFSGTF